MILRRMLFIFLFAIVGRLLPHPSNMTPLIALCLFSGLYLPVSVGLMTLLSSYFFTDLALSHINDFPLLGSWSFYTYTGTLGLIYLGKKIRAVKTPLFLWVAVGSLSFWLWTNLGVWLHSGLYPMTSEGLVLCYSAAIPFLQNAILGDVFWVTLLSLSLPTILIKIQRPCLRQLEINPEFSWLLLQNSQ